MFRLKIETDNDAFVDAPHETLAELLREAAAKLETGKNSGTLYDVNGNIVGIFAYKP